MNNHLQIAGVFHGMFAIASQVLSSNSTKLTDSSSSLESSLFHVPLSLLLRLLKIEFISLFILLLMISSVVFGHRTLAQLTQITPTKETSSGMRTIEADSMRLRCFQSVTGMLAHPSPVPSSGTPPGWHNAGPLFASLIL